MSFKLKLAAKICNRNLNVNVLRVTSIEEYIKFGFPPEKCCLIYTDWHKKGCEILSINWGAIIVQSLQSEKKWQGTLIQITEPENCLENGDIITLSDNFINIVYKYQSNSNLLFLTGQCDNFCIMCSQPPSFRDDSWRINEALEIVSLLDDNNGVLGISGGEPTLYEDGFIQTISYCRDKIPNTTLHILTNGKKLSEQHFINRISSIAHNKIIWGIPLYGSTPHEHDYHVQCQGAFNKTINGLYNLSLLKQTIELRVVLTIDVLNQIERITDFIIRNLPFVSIVAFMGVELTGFAKVNYKNIYPQFHYYLDNLGCALTKLQRSGIVFSLYNIPLCHLPVSIRSHAAQSISDWKNIFSPTCSKCQIRELCCGFFESNFHHKIGIQKIPLESINDNTYITRSCY